MGATEIKPLLRKDKQLLKKFGITSDVQIKLAIVELQIKPPGMEGPKKSSSSKRRQSKVFKFKCAECPFNSTLRYDLKVHIQAVHQKLKPLQCSFCKRSFARKTKTELKIHSRIHTGEKPYSCSFCSYKSTIPSNLNRHTRTHTLEKPYKCPDPNCDYSTATSSNIAKHVKSQHGKNSLKPSFPCKLCSKMFMTQNGLYSHILIHTGEKPYACQFCQKEFKLNRATLNHEIICKLNPKHHDKTWLANEKKFKCTICDFRTIVNSTLKAHLRFHSGQKPFSCKLCSFKCTLKGNLKQHEQSHTGQKRFPCSQCQSKYTTRFHLKKHVEKMHC